MSTTVETATATRPLRVKFFLVDVNEAERGGHFAAWGDPAVFAQELRAGFQSLR